MRTTVLPAILLVVLAGGALTGCTSGPDGPTASPRSSPSPSRSATASPTGPTDPATASPSTPAEDDAAPAPAPVPDPGPGGTTPEPVPSASAAGWTDASAHEACVEHATETEGAGYTWSVRDGQTMVYQGGERTIDVAGIYQGGDVGVANVVYRCVLGGEPSAPQLSGGLVR